MIINSTKFYKKGLIEANMYDMYGSTEYFVLVVLYG